MCLQSASIAIATRSAAALPFIRENICCRCACRGFEHKYSDCNARFASDCASLEECAVRAAGHAECVSASKHTVIAYGTWLLRKLTICFQIVKRPEVLAVADLMLKVRQHYERTLRHKLGRSHRHHTTLAAVKAACKPFDPQLSE